MEPNDQGKNWKPEPETTPDVVDELKRARIQFQRELPGGEWGDAGADSPEWFAKELKLEPKAEAPTYSVGASDVGISELGLAALRNMAEGRGLEGTDARTIELLASHHLIVASGDRPEDGWQVSRGGAELLQQCGTFLSDPIGNRHGTPRGARARPSSRLSFEVGSPWGWAGTAAFAFGCAIVGAAAAVLFLR